MRTLLGLFESGDDGNIVSLDGPLTRNPSRQPTTVGEAELVEIQRLETEVSDEEISSSWLLVLYFLSGGREDVELHSK